MFNEDLKYLTLTFSGWIVNGKRVILDVTSETNDEAIVENDDGQKLILKFNRQNNIIDGTYSCSNPLDYGYFSIKLLTDGYS
jgi:hypothetical protein